MIVNNPVNKFKYPNANPVLIFLVILPPITPQTNPPKTSDIVSKLKVCGPLPSSLAIAGAAIVNELCETFVRQAVINNHFKYGMFIK
ncbi:hypothetical protein PcaKH15_17740 [Parageobacillus caldoxylosilyticus]|nr:hypothetical protein PcaKH15_17740 [Parageobacillus caldoxylosilyticus]BDG39650.1 hypothetical protein PcaKH16_17890 [Parageobacillus caldoxylosilyticus]BDG43422.1 hypothetical protein PcaKH35_17670 [Parageobacillus caldoxylosilyticus]